LIGQKSPIETIVNGILHRPYGKSLSRRLLDLLFRRFVDDAWILIKPSFSWFDNFYVEEQLCPPQTPGFFFPLKIAYARGAFRTKIAILHKGVLSTLIA
jgi:hypothetical protein